MREGRKDQELGRERGRRTSRETEKGGERERCGLGKKQVKHIEAKEKQKYIIRENEASENTRKKT